MKKKIMVIVLMVSLFQSLRAESFDDPFMFEEQHHVLSDIELKNDPIKQKLSVWAALQLAPRYVYEAHLKPGVYAVVAALFAPKEELSIEG